MTLKKKTSLLSDSRFPAFIRDNPEYDMLRRFLQSYFESLEQEGGASFEINNARENSDVDTTTESYLLRMFQELCPNLPKNIISDKRFLLKHSRELYEKKGTPDSFKMLFRILFNEFISLKYPNENILRASDGIWNQPVSMQVHMSGPINDVLSLVNQEITTINGSGIVRNFIRQIRHLGDSVYEIVIDKQKNLQFFVNDVVSSNGMTGYILPSPTKIEILKAGKKFTPGQLIKLDIDTSVGTLAKVISTTSEGAIKKIQIIKFGKGYGNDFSLTISPLKNKAAMQTQTNEISGPNLPLSEAGNGFIETGSISQTGKLGPTYDYFLDDYVENEYIASIIRQFNSITPPPIDNDGITEDDYAILNIKVGAIATYPGFWSNSRGKLSDPLICLQDNDFYQDFSYVIQSSVPRELYLKHVKQNVHPAGLKVFSDLLLDNTIDISGTVANIDGMKYRMYINDMVDAPDQSHYDMIMPKEDYVENSEFITKQLDKNTFDDVVAAEAHLTDISKGLSDSTITADVMGQSYGMTFSDYVDNGERDNYVDEGFVNDLYTTQSNGPTLSISTLKSDFNSVADNTNSEFTFGISESVTTGESGSKNITQSLSDSTTLLDVASKLPEKVLSEFITTEDVAYSSQQINIDDITTIIDNTNKYVINQISDTVVASELLNKDQILSFSDSVNNGESDKYFEDGYTNDYYTVQNTGLTITQP